MNYPNLKTVTIKGVLSKISNSAFEGCKQIKSITATGAVNAAGKKCFSLVNVHLKIALVLKV